MAEADGPARSRILEHDRNWPIFRKSMTCSSSWITKTKAVSQQMMCGRHSKTICPAVRSNNSSPVLLETPTGNEEFMAQLIAAKEPEENALLMRIFNVVDTDNMWHLTREQVQALIKRPNVAHVLRDNPEQLVDMMGRDRDRRITFEEFKYVVQGRRRGHSYQEGQKIFFWSSSYDEWCRGKVLNVRDSAV